MAHRRKPRGFLKRLILVNAFHDRKLAETICTTTKTVLIPLVEKEFGVVDMSIFREDPGDVLLDSRGRGLYQ